MSKWQHPIHARGVRSPAFGTAITGKILSDKKVHAYAKAGWYGTENQAAACAADKKKVKKPKQLTLAAALRALGIPSHAK